MDTETEVLEWLKPSSTTGSLHSLVGMPWEIFRTQDLTPDHPHTVDIYAKAGAAYGYQSHMAVIDEYGIAVVVLTAGSLEAANVIYDTVLSALVPIIDQLARDQAVQYTGTFTGGTDTVSSVSVMQDQQSLVLAGLERNGTDILESLRNILSVAIGSFSDLVPSQARIYPVGIETTSEASKVTKRTKTVILQDWRIDWGFDFEPASELPGAGLSSKNCLAWILTDWIHYGSEPLDRMVFVLDSADRHVVGVEVPFLRTGLLLKA